MTADDEWNCQGASGRCDESSSSTSTSTSSKSKSKATKGTKATASGSDDAVNCSTHDDCNDLYPDQLDDNWLAVTDDKKPTTKAQKEAAKAAKAAKALKADNDNPMTADDEWNCQGASGRCDESSTTSSSKTSKSEKKSTKGTKSTDSGSDDAVNCSTHDDCNDLYPDQLDDNWLAVTDDKKKKSSGSGSGSKKV